MPLTLKKDMGGWIKDFQKSKAPQFKNSSQEKRKTQAIAARLHAEKLNEENSFEDLRNRHISEGMGHLKSRIGSLEIRPKQLDEQPISYEMDAEERKEKLSEVGNRAHLLYREKVNPKPEKEAVDVSEPETMATRAQRKAAMNAAIGIRNGGNSGRPTAPAGDNGGSTGTGGDSINVGLYPTSLTIEEYEAFINEKFAALVKEEEEQVFTELREEEERGVDIVAILKGRLLTLEDTSWQSVDSEMRQLIKEHGIKLNELQKAFKRDTGMVAEVWIKENRIVEECGVFPLDEITRLNSTGIIYEVSLIFRGVTKRLKFFWPNLHRPTKEQMKHEVDKFYPGASVLIYYPSNDSQNTSMITVSPRFENYVVYSEDDWQFMSEESTAIYEEICAEEGEPVSAPYLVEEGVYEVKIEDHDTGEERVVRFNEIGNPGNGKSYLKNGEIDKITK